MRRNVAWSTLIISNDDPDAETLLATLQARGHSVTRCAPAAAADAPHTKRESPPQDACLGAGPFHLAFLAVPLPEAREHCRRLQEMEGGDHTVISLVLDPKDLSEVERLSDTGAHDFLVRSLSADQVEARLVFLEQWAHSLMERTWTEQALRESQERARDLFENTPIGIYQTTPDGRMLMANPQMARMLGYESFEDLAENNLEEKGFWPTYPRERFKEQIEKTGEIRGYEAAWTRRDGKVLFVRENARIARDENGRALYYTGTVEDITEQRRAEEALQASEQRYALVATSANDGLWEWDLRKDRLYLSPRWLEMLGYGPGDLPPKKASWFDRVHPDDLPTLEAELDAHLAGASPRLEREHRLRHADGAFRWMLCRGVAVRDEEGHPLRMAGSITDVSDRREVEEQLQHHVLHDPLTGLPNRSLFLDHLRTAMSLTRNAPGSHLAVLLLDLDRFKLINESLGHDKGDLILSELAARLQGCLQTEDTLARVGGDEFALLLEGLQDLGEARQMGQRIQKTLSDPVSVAGNEVFITASLGIAPHGAESERAEDLMQDAEIAMYRAKALGRARHVVFDPAMRTRAVAWLKIETELRHALERRELRLHYQPIVRLSTGKISGFEALLRWQHPELGLIPPSKFVHVAEDSGLIVSIGEWVLREASRQARAWHVRLPSHRHLVMNVNLSGRQFTDRQLHAKVARALEDTKLSPGTLKLEITESVLMADQRNAVRLLSELKSLHVQIGIDDFGTGYSSFSHLELFPVDTLKIDRSFVSKMGLDGEKHQIVDAIITLARNLELDVVAEGVETPGQLAQLRQLGCGYVQGFLLARPLPEPAAEELLIKNPTW